MKILTSVAAFALLAASTSAQCETASTTCDDAPDSTASVRLASHTPMAPASEHSDIVATAVAAGSFETLAKALSAAGLVETLEGDGPFTVFAPTDDAFANVPEDVLAGLLAPESRRQLVDVLTYHVVPGRVLASDVVKLDSATTVNGQRIDIRTSDDGVFVDGARVVTTDIQCSNGVIHVIDAVILPNVDDVVTTARRAGSFQTLLAAVTAAELAETLQGDGPFTVFAPTDAAFAALPEGTVASLLEPENRDRLVAILTYHVVPGRVFAADAIAARTAASLQGGELSFSIEGDRVLVDGATVLSADVETRNGVIHVIDSVLMPE